AERDARAESRFGLRRTHRQRDDLAAAVPFLERYGLRDRGGIERVQEQRHALAPQRLRLRIALDRVGAWNLLDQADDLHVWEPNRACSPSCTTSTGIWLRSRKSSVMRRPPVPTATCSAATSRRGRRGRSRRSLACAASRTRPGSGATGNAGCANCRSTARRSWTRCVSATRVLGRRRAGCTRSRRRRSWTESCTSTVRLFPTSTAFRPSQGRTTSGYWRAFVTKPSSSGTVTCSSGGRGR